MNIELYLFLPYILLRNIKKIWNLIRYITLTVLKD